ncbi:MAG: methylmalonyl Co-A mutase-associated GTPase MeaB [Planctomycetes bacterium]|nr:methylmalonyl Co-A mutase-associated GTPase MeaB [Planctomycetota bacterium]
MAQPSLSQRLVQGEKAALARLISWAENGDARFAETLRELGPRASKSWRTGITGPPGAGKSTLVNELARELRTHARTVGILAVDPSSPFSGGALLGDRIRMEERTVDPGVFIRSMASRGAHGGIARAAVDACDAIEAAGYDEILLETVGVGQAEYDVVSAADTVLVVLCPGAGDGIQAMKAGILEVADVLVVNKADLAGADRLATDLEEAVHIRATGGARDPQGWAAPVVTCSAGTGKDIDEVLRQIEKHRSWLAGERLERARREKRLRHVRRTVEEQLAQELWERRGWNEKASALLESGRAPYDVVETLVSSILGAAKRDGVKSA